ncbi:MAG: phage major capsid protein [Synechococcus sp.]|nr:phage major capsid protein [Synechococcus sp.]
MDEITTPNAFEEKVLSGVKSLADKSKSLEERLEKAASTEDLVALKGEVEALTTQTRALRKASLSAPRNVRKGQISDDAARYVGGLTMLSGLRGGQLSGDRVEGLCKDILGGEAEFKAALTTSDIPLPVEYSGQIVELVNTYGAARQYGTVFPLGAGTVKLPKLSTDPTFGLIAMSAAVPEKSPAFSWVTFNAEKFGGLVRVPSEIDEDSIVAVGQFVARYSARNMALAEDHNFFVGTGAGSGINGSVKGLALSVIDNSAVVTQASTKTKTSDVTLANVRATRSLVATPALLRGAYYAHPSMEQAFSSFNTAGDMPYQANAAQGATLDGFPIRWIDTLPAYSTSAQAGKVYVLFGDVSYQYLGVRGGMRFDTSREAGFTTDEILVRALERFTIGLMADNAVSGLQTAAS